MKRLLPLLVIVVAACAHHPTDTASNTDTATASASATATASATEAATGTPPPMPAAALLWSAETPPEGNLDTRDGTLKKTPKPSADEVDQQARIYPFEMDQYQITRTDLDAVLAPWVGRPIRIEGVFSKVFHQEDGSWTYHVDPSRITLLK